MYANVLVDSSFYIDRLRAGEDPFEEFAEHGWDADEIPDPQDPETFRRSKLTRERDPGLAELYATLLRARSALPPGEVTTMHDDDERWLTVDRGPFRLCCNFADATQALALDGHAEIVLVAGVVGARSGALVR